MTKETYEKAISLTIEIEEIESHIQDIDNAFSLGKNLEYKLDMGCGSQSLYMEKLYPIHPKNFMLQYRQAAVKRLALLKRQFKRL